MATPKNFVSEITPASLVIRKQAILSLSSGTGSIGGVADEVLLAETDLNNGDYVATIHEAEGTETNPEDNASSSKNSPNELLTVASGFAGNPGDRLSGSVSNAIGKIIQVTGTTVYFYYVSEALFTTSDTITNETSTNTSTNSRACSAVTVDSKDISNNFLFSLLPKNSLIM